MRRLQLLEQMEKSELTPTFHEKLFTWFPQKMQGLTKKPTKIDYIFTSEQIQESKTDDQDTKIPR